MRREYSLAELTETEINPDPLAQFQKWVDEAGKAGIVEPNAMTLATVGPDGRPSARIVLLKIADERGFGFFTNYESRKGRELESNPRAALCFFWPEVERQVCVEGTVSKLSRQESEGYFHSRPHRSRLAAWASRQSQVLSGREELARKMIEVEGTYPGDVVPTPEYWGGYMVRPERIEFWQGQASRLHDRLAFLRRPDAGWDLRRLSP
jgi:pyridoxamine 5'-phosphate oxidase